MTGFFFGVCGGVFVGGVGVRQRSEIDIHYPSGIRMTKKGVPESGTPFRKEG